MKSISFKNFRRFADFPKFRLGDITILVGGNNAGKSTFFKALRFLIHNLKNLKVVADPSRRYRCMPTFKAGKFVNFQRIHKNDTNEQMSFSLSFDKVGEFSDYFTGVIDKERFIISVVLKNASPDDIEIPIESISIQDNELGYRILFKSPEDGLGYDVELEWVSLDMAEIEAVENADSLYPVKVKMPIEEFLYKYNEKIYEHFYLIDTHEGYMYDKAFINCFLQNNVNRINVVEDKLPNFDKKISFSSGICESEFDNAPLNGIEELIKDVCLTNIDISTNPIKWRLYESAKRIDSIIRRMHIQEVIDAPQRRDIYQPTDSMYHLIETFLNNTDDDAAFLLPENGKMIINTAGDKYKSKLRKYLTDFEIGQDYCIERIKNCNVYIITIQGFDGQWVNLSDLGSGSIKLFELFLNILTMSRDSILLVEEPEHNLHPNLQSRLADFFYECRKNSSKNIVIETHSEYLIRRTQVLVAEMNICSEDDRKNQNPFKVYYFPGNGIPYDMHYLPSGRFENKFGEGFFDESAKWHMEILKKEKARK